MLATVPFVVARIGKVVIRQDIVRARADLCVPAMYAIVSDLMAHAAQRLVADAAILRIVHARF